MTDPLDALKAVSIKAFFDSFPKKPHCLPKTTLALIEGWRVMESELEARLSRFRKRATAADHACETAAKMDWVELIEETQEALNRVAEIKKGI